MKILITITLNLLLTNSIFANDLERNYDCLGDTYNKVPISAVVTEVANYGCLVSGPNGQILHYNCEQNEAEIGDELDGFLHYGVHLLANLECRPYSFFKLN